MPTVRTRAAKGSDLTPTEADSNFKKTVRQVTTTAATLISDNRGVVEGSSATPFTITLLAVATAAAAEPGDYSVTISNIGTGAVTVDANSTETINGSTDTLTLAQYSSVRLEVDSAGTGWQVTARTGNYGVVQRVYTQTSAVSATTTSQIPADDTIPQNTEGLEVMTLAITPQSTSNILEIKVVCDTSSTDGTVAALFQDSTADALAAMAESANGANTPANLTFTHTMTAGTTSATTFKVRIGALSVSDTVCLNGQTSGTRRFGGVASSSIVITEYMA